MEARVMKWMIITVAVASALYFASIVKSDINEVHDALQGMDLRYLVTAIALSTAAYLVRALRWNYYLGRLGVDLDNKASLLFYFAGLSMLITPAMISGVVKVGLVKVRLGTDLSRTFPIVVVERLTDLVGMILLAAMGVYFFGLGYISMGGVIIFLLVVLAMVRVPRMRHAILSGFARIPRAGRHVETFNRSLESANTLLDRQAFIVGSLFSYISWALVGLSFYVLVLAFEVEVTLLESMFIFAFPAILGIMSQSPGGLGVEEIGIWTLLIMKGVGEADATALWVVFRLVTLWLGLVLGLIAISFFAKEITNGDGSGDGGANGARAMTTFETGSTAPGPGPGERTVPGRQPAPAKEPSGGEPDDNPA